MLVIESENTLTIRQHSENMTDEEFFNFCIENKELRIERDQHGNIIIMPPTTGESGYYEKKATAKMDNYEVNYSGVSFGSNAGFKLPNGATRAPDACWISNERWSTLTKADVKKFMPVVPDFIIEIRSETDRLKPLQTKMHEWIENGVRLGWLIDPKTKITHIYRKNGSIEIIEGFDKTLSGEDVMPEFEFDLGLLKMPDFKK